MTACRIAEGDLDDPRVVDLIEYHAASARAATVGGDGHSFSAERLRSPDIRLFTAWIGNELAGIGALKDLGDSEGEIKSMHTAASARGQGIGDAMLSHIVAAAKGSEMKRLLLETHPGEHFAAAIALYRKHGFVECGPFADYEVTPASLYMCKELY